MQRCDSIGAFTLLLGYGDVLLVQIILSALQLVGLVSANTETWGGSR